MNERPTCSRCLKPITGIIKIYTSMRKLGGKSTNQVDYYDEECFKIRNKEKALNELQKERTNQKKNKR